MKHFNKTLLAAALALACCTNAYADSFFVSADPGTVPGVSTMTWSFNDIAVGTSHAVGGAFDDLFVFNVPDAETVSFDVEAFNKSVDFKGSNYKLWGGAGIAFGGSSDLLDKEKVTTKYAFDGGDYSLTSGTYVLEVKGTYTKYNGFYDGQITGIAAAVPEPSSVLMLLAGLAGIAGVARRRKNQA